MACLKFLSRFPRHNHLFTEPNDSGLGPRRSIFELELTEGATEAVLTGKTKSGAEIMGKDSVRIVPE